VWAFEPNLQGDSQLPLGQSWLWSDKNFKFDRLVSHVDGDGDGDIVDSSTAETENSSSRKTGIASPRAIWKKLPKGFERDDPEVASRWLPESDPRGPRIFLGVFPCCRLPPAGMRYYPESCELSILLWPSLTRLFLKHAAVYASS